MRCTLTELEDEKHPLDRVFLAELLNAKTQLLQPSKYQIRHNHELIQNENICEMRIVELLNFSHWNSVKGWLRNILSSRYL